MSEKNRDNCNRWRSKTIAFRVSPEENELLNKQVRLSGLTKQEYLTSNMLKRDIIVVGNPRVHKALKNQIDEMISELRRINDASKIDSEFMGLMTMALEIYVGLGKDGK